jgi:hypothetical protein
MKNFLKIAKDTWLNAKRTVTLVLITSMVAGPILLLSQTATAAQVTTRSLAISNPQAGATANYVVTYNPGSTTQVESLRLSACTTPLGTCTVPTGISISTGTLTTSGFQGATAFTQDTTATGCTTAGVLCAKRTDTTAQTVATAHVLTDTGVTNQNSTNCSSAANCTFFIRIATFSDNAYTTAVDSGVVASSTTQLFTINAAIQEQLAFCIGNTSVNDATTTVPTCPSITGTSVNLGTLSSTAVSVTPVTTTYNGDANNGLAELSTNADLGASVAYNAVQQSGTNHPGALRVVGATCNAGSVTTDQCINSIGATKATLTAGTEDYGMTIAGVNCSNVGSAYTCSFAGGNFNLVPTTNYNCNGTTNGGHSNTYPSDTNQVSGTTACSYAWDESGTTDTIASSSSIVGGEALILKFAATPSLVTPTGSYTAQADFIATPTY